MPFAVCNGVRLYYEVHGAGEPLLLVMGQGSDHHGWDPVVEDFAARYQVIVYDHRGTGQSDKPTEPPYTTRMLAADAVALLGHLGIDRAHVYRVSMGGRSCQRVAIDDPERVRCVDLGCATPGDAHGVKRPAEVDAKMRNGPQDPEAAASRPPGKMVSRRWPSEHPEYLAFFRERARNPIPAYAQRLHYEASQGHDGCERLTEIRAPVLVIHGTEDRINPTANAELLAGRIPGAELYLVRGGRHGHFIDFREEAGAAVMGFLERHTTR